MTIASWIRVHRTRCRWTQIDLAQRLNLGPSAVSRWERGLHDPSVGQFKQMCQLFKQSADDALNLRFPRKARRKRQEVAAA